MSWIEAVTTIEVEGGASYEIAPAKALRGELAPEAIDAAWRQVAAQLPGGLTLVGFADAGCALRARSRVG